MRTPRIDTNSYALQRLKACAGGLFLSGALLFMPGKGMAGQALPSVSLKDFPGGNSRDQTDWIQKALEATSKKHQRLLIPRSARPYRVRPIQVPSNASLVFESGVVWQAAAGYRELQRLLNVVNVREVEIIGNGATLRMNRNEYNTGEYRHCVFISGSTAVHIQGLTCADAGGDGFYVSGSEKKPYSEDIRLYDVTAEGSRRNGLTVISARNLTVSKSRFARSFAVKPSSGIDLEPEAITDRLDGVVLEGNHTEENAGQGVRLAVSKLSAKSYPVRVVISHHRDLRSGGSSLVATNETGGQQDVGGTVDVNYFSSEAARLYGILFSFWNAGGPKVTVSDATIVNANGARATEDNVALAVIRGGGGKGRMGNIEFVRTSIRDTSSKPHLDHYFSFHDYSRIGFLRVAFSQPGVLSGAVHQHPSGLFQGLGVDSIALNNPAALSRLWQRAQGGQLNDASKAATNLVTATR